MPRLKPLLLAGVALATGCDSSLPGEVIGAFSVVLRLEENSCGSAVRPFADGQRYAVELRSDEGEVGFWRLPKAPPVRGRFHDDSFAFQFAQAIELGMADAGTSGCTVLREELLEGKVRGRVTQADGAVVEGDAGTALEGFHNVAFRADPSGRCRDAHGPLREFDRLPCAARYRLDGTARGAF